MKNKKNLPMAQDTSKRRVSGLVIIVLPVQLLNVVVVTWLPVAASSCRGGDVAASGCVVVSLCIVVVW
jgi:hypothetical protein